MERSRTLRSIRLLLAFFIAALAVSGLTAVPLRAELEAANHFIAQATWAPEAVAAWLLMVRDAVDTTLREYPFLGYGTDWLAFAHIVIALGPFEIPSGTGGHGVGDGGLPAGCANSADLRRVARHSVVVAPSGLLIRRFRRHSALDLPSVDLAARGLARLR
jgi:hypothetical protein